MQAAEFKRGKAVRTRSWPVLFTRNGLPRLPGFTGQVVVREQSQTRAARQAKAGLAERRAAGSQTTVLVNPFAKSNG
jgi:hypothetical protein